MKTCKIITKVNEDIAILIKRGTELISITVDKNNNIEINGYENDMVLLEEIAVTQLQNQKMENDLMDTIMNMQDINELSLMKNKEEKNWEKKGITG